jgi:WD40 repeat protein
MASLQESWEYLENERERVFFLVASFSPENTPVPLWLLGLAAGQMEPKASIEPLERACRQLQALGLFEIVTGGQVRLHQEQRQLGQQLVQAESIQRLMRDAAERLFSACWIVDALSQRALQIGYHACREQVHLIRAYLDWLGFRELSNLVKRLEGWLELESSLLVDPLIDNTTWWPQILPDLFCQQLYNRSVEAKSSLPFPKEASCWIRLTRKVGAEDFLFLRLYPLGQGWRRYAPSYKVGLGTSPNTLTCVAFSPDGRLVTGSLECGVQFWDVESGCELPRLQGDTRGVTSVAFSPDGHLALTGDHRGAVWLWEAESRLRLRGWQCPGASGITCLAFSPDGRLALAGTNSTGAIRLWDVESGRELRSLSYQRENVTGVAFSPDGRLALIGSDFSLGRAHLWEVENEGSLRDLLHQDSEIKDKVRSVAFSPDGRLALIGTDRAVLLCEVESGKIVRQMPHLMALSVAFSPDGCLALIGDHSGQVWLWEVESGQRTRLPRHMYDVFSVAWSPDGKRVLTGSSDNVARLWDVSREGDALDWPPSLIECIAFSPDGQLALTGSENGEVRFWDVSAGQSLQLMRKEGVWNGGISKKSCIAFSPDGRFALIGSYEIAYLWEVESRQQIGVLNMPEGMWVMSVAFSPDGRFALTGHSFPGTVLLWNMEKRYKIRELRHSDIVNSVAFSPNGYFALTGSENGRVHLWDVSRGRKVRQLRHRLPVKSVAFSPDGSLALTSTKHPYSRVGAVQLWDVKKGRTLQQLLYSQEATSVSFSPDGRLAIVCNKYGQIFFYRGQEPDMGKLLGIYTAAYEVGAIYWQSANQLVVADKGGPTWQPHFSQVTLEGRWE